eukprot:974699-Rhodomonas_salina.1
MTLLTVNLNYEPYKLSDCEPNHCFQERLSPTVALRLEPTDPGGGAIRKRSAVLGRAGISIPPSPRTPPSPEPPWPSRLTSAFSESACRSAPLGRVLLEVFGRVRVSCGAPPERDRDGR